MILIKEKHENYTIAGFEEGTGKLIITNSDQAKIKLNEIVDNGCSNLILDFKNVSFIDSTGFGSLVTVFNHAKNSKTNLVFCNISSQTQTLLKITRLDQVFEIYASLDEAVNAVS